MVEVGGSGNYLKDNKTSKNQARVTLTYLANTKVQELSIKHLNEVLNHSEVFEQGVATHVVTAILFGAQAFFVFDREVSEDENIEDIKGDFQLSIKSKDKISVNGEASVRKNDTDRKLENKFSCTFYGDFMLQKTPLTFQEAMQLYQNLPELLGPNGEHAVPLKVWMMPLSILHPSAAKLARQVSAALVQEAQRVLEDFNQLEVRCNDAIKATAEKFPQNSQILKHFKDMCSDLKLELQQDLAKMLPLIRGGAEEEAVLADILKKRHSSPFSNKRLNQWMEFKEKESCFLKALISMMKNAKILPFPNQLYEESLSAEHVFCFVFTSVGDDEPFLSAFEKHIKGTKTDGAYPEKDHWLTTEIEDKMKRNAKYFRDFAERRKEEKNVKFVAVALKDDEYSKEGSTIYHYRNGICENKCYWEDSDQ
ncbi:stonustoxin subunit alpha-like [Cyprinodon tularosa]|uniref:stonustoxin subunit alpha-like n=1 Tax=Cyprinodon tularosa TaxID=77115 RepID=UPI0018E1F9B3|nr:stonustoxin subunit alpha-like [Cyprinodon tularosa]